MRRGWVLWSLCGLGCPGDGAGTPPPSTTTSALTQTDTGGDDTGPGGSETTASTTTGDDGTTSADVDSTGSDDAIFDVGTALDIGRPECIPCEIALMTTQSNALVESMGAPLFVTADLDGDLVFGLGEAGAGRLAFSGDGNVIYREGTCPLWEWLGATGAQPPRVLCIGADWPCRGETDAMPPLEINLLHTYPGQLDYGGLTLPAQYEGDPSALHTDYDLVVYFAVLDFATGGWDYDPGDVGTLESFVRDEGGGLYLIGEYWGGGMGTEQLDSLNALAAPYDIAFQQLSLAWGPAGATVELDCFPSPAG